MAPNPGFVFVTCSGPDHKADKKLLPKLRQHVMLHHLRTKDQQQRRRAINTAISTQSSPDSTDEEETTPYAEHARQVLQKSQSRSRRQDSLIHTSNGHDTLAIVPLVNTSATTPLGAPFDPFDVLPVKGVKDMGSIYQWFYSGQHDASATQWRNSTRYHWLDKHWELTRQSEAAFNFTLCFALEKKGIITRTSQAARIFQHRNAVLRALQRDLATCDGKLSGFTVGTMGGLAYVALRDGEVEVARAHIRAVARLAVFEEYEMHVWLFTVWTDLRLAAVTFGMPEFKYYVPPECRGGLALTKEEEVKAKRLAERNAEVSSAVSDAEVAQSLFRKMHEACMAVDKKDVDLLTLYGHLYDLNYRLLVMTSVAWGSADGAESTVARTVLLTMQLTFWTSTFYVLPQGRKFNVDLHAEIWGQMGKLGSAVEDVVIAWTEVARLDSLLWVVFMLSGSALECDQNRMPEFVKALKKVVSVMGLGRKDDFEKALGAFPWTEHWSARTCSLVWAQVTGEHILSVSEPVQQMFWIEEMSVR
ncbi:hypothetical protein C1H76_0439 [Elsinoe australis]|uniref:Uncharacterized protein n=1 Tax=Elsinoe australis TaxID=40998 RepID=A0A4U7BDN6_9PEZI|nr:hypothetical protein C1H76_0439 [Elsinoe australis]